ncbi:hypothetical protein KM803_10060 [Clostridium tyrobutyricum]|uniref:hypothetical protein n=1 Tax=Clostridium tyrobutyricum TaxID=1519 RepID=UPI001C3803C6|nr:hypothetical protein [Clostridium tyrobutyricum]MBV4431674.1 hypothetical protein [Clostridium tyrobutyricum]
MIKYLNALLWKEFKLIKQNVVSKFISQLSINIILIAILILRVKISKLPMNIDTIINITTYVLIITGYISFISNLKFWQEKSFKTIESLLATPIPIYIVVISKILAPIIFSIIVILINYSIYEVFFALFFKYNIFRISSLLIAIALSSFFDYCYGIITAYSMWCASIGVAKILQYLSIGIYLSSIFSIFFVPSNINLLNSNIKYAFILLVIVSFYCFIFINKEKCITSLQD